jgi:hypothetical protein
MNGTTFMMIMFSLIGIYIFTIFFLTRLIVPNMGFRKSKLPEKIPESMQRAINKIKRESHSKHEFLKKTYDFLSNKQCGERVKTITKMHLLWKPVEFIWKKEGFIHCTWHNLLLRIFLVRSGFFKDDDIRIKHTFADFDIHQYTEVKIGDKWIPVDIWSNAFGIKFGEKPTLWM